MNKMVAVLFIVLVLSGVTCGFLFYGNSDLLTQNSELRRQADELFDQNTELSNQSIKLKNENNDLLDRTDELNEQNNRLVSQNNGLQNELSVLESQVNGYQNLTSEMQSQVNELKQQNLELQNQISELENLTRRATNFVKITDLSTTGRWDNLVSVGLWLFFNVTIENMQDSDVHDVILVVKMKDLNENVCTNYTQNFDVIHAGESKEITGYIVTNYDHIAEVVDSDFVATLKVVGEVVLDEYTIRSTNNAKITEFSADGPDTSVANVTRWRFDVTIENKGGNDISEMALVVRMRQNGMIVAQSTTQLNVLHIGEVQKIELIIEGGTELSGSKEEYTFDAILTLSGGNIIVDYPKLPL